MPKPKDKCACGHDWSQHRPRTGECRKCECKKFMSQDQYEKMHAPHPQECQCVNCRLDKIENQVSHNTSALNNIWPQFYRDITEKGLSIPTGFTVVLPHDMTDSLEGWKSWGIVLSEPNQYGGWGVALISKDDDLKLVKVGSDEEGNYICEHIDTLDKFYETVKSRKDFDQIKDRSDKSFDLIQKQMVKQKELEERMAEAVKKAEEEKAKAEKQGEEKQKKSKTKKTETDKKKSES